MASVRTTSNRNSSLLRRQRLKNVRQLRGWSSHSPSTMPGELLTIGKLVQ